MASKVIGRANCPECGFESAHVKQSEKCVYRYCPECGSQHHARTDRQRADLLAKTRLVEGSHTPTPTEAVGEGDELPTPTPAPAVGPATTPAAQVQKKRSGLFGVPV